METSAQFISIPTVSRAPKPIHHPRPRFRSAQSSQQLYGAILLVIDRGHRFRSLQFTVTEMTLLHNLQTKATSFRVFGQRVENRGRQRPFASPANHILASSDERSQM